MSDVRDRLAKLERLVGEKLKCECGGAVAIRVVGIGEKLKDEDRPLPCARCGVEPDLIIVESAITGRVGSMRKAARDGIDLAGSLRIDEPVPGKVVAPPVSEASPVVAVDATKQPEPWRAADGLPRTARWVPRHEIAPEPPARAPDYDPLAPRWR